MKKYILIMLLFIICSSISLTYADEKIPKTALLIIDIQNFYFPSENNPGLVGAEAASEVAQKVLDTFRQENLPVIHVRHQAKNGFEIRENVKPLPNEKIITKTEINSFVGTDLQEYLQHKNINRLVIVGMQTHMCLEAATRAAHDLGYECIVVEDGCATRDLKYGETVVTAANVQASTLESLTYGGYATVITLAEFNKDTDKFLTQSLK